MNEIFIHKDIFKGNPQDFRRPVRSILTLFPYKAYATDEELFLLKLKYNVRNIIGKWWIGYHE